MPRRSCQSTHRSSGPSSTAIGRQTRAENLSEELRILYVAMTRAKDMLIMSCCGESIEKHLSDLTLCLTPETVGRLAAQAGCMGDWVLLTALLRTEAGALHAVAGKPAGTAVSEIPWKIQWHELPVQTAWGSAAPAAALPQEPVDIQALAARSYYQVPRRTVNGMDNSRVILLLAVMEKRAGMKLYDKDVYINVAGGLDLTEPAADLAVCCAVASSMCDRPLPPDVCVVGEVGLAGEIRAVPRLERRVQECVRLGFTRVICPRDSAAKIKNVPDAEIRGVDTIAQAFAVLDVFPSRQA